MSLGPSSFSAQDLLFLTQTGRQLESVQEQLDRFQSGFPALRLVKAARIGEGILKVEPEDMPDLIQGYAEAVKQRRSCKFVPASGAASRMFRSLYGFLDAPDQMSKEIERFFSELPSFAFYAALEASLKEKGEDIKDLLSRQAYSRILQELLLEAGMNYGQLPKALICFHREKGSVRTALEEHLIEGMNYCRSKDGQVHLHITLSPQHISLVQAFLEEVLSAYEAQFDVRFHISMSTQDPTTDTIAVDMDNQPMRDEEGQLIFRPGGHGALLSNLNQIDADWVFIKNVDNVTTDLWKHPTYLWKETLGGLFVRHQEKIFAYLRRLDEEATMPEALEKEIIAYMKEELNITSPLAYSDWSLERRKAHLHKKLNRPLRVCGVIRTEEQTGGGPFWIEESDGSLSLQLVETAQINLEDSQQQEIAAQSSFANITDLVCGWKTYQGHTFDLMQYRDPETGFITQKSLNGQALKAQELPGLWNGSMADWTTILVEVPTSTFNPVKSVMDLLEAAHQG